MKTSKRKTPKRYAIGARVERMTRQKLYDDGAVLVLKAGGSKIIWPKEWEDLKPKVDLIALFPQFDMVMGVTVLLVQCKRRGVVSKLERSDLQRFEWRYQNVDAALARLEKGEIILDHFI